GPHGHAGGGGDRRPGQGPTRARLAAHLVRRLRVRAGRGAARGPGRAVPRPRPGRGQERAGLLPAAGPGRPVRLPAVEESRARVVGLPGGQPGDRAAAAAVDGAARAPAARPAPRPRRRRLVARLRDGPLGLTLGGGGRRGRHGPAVRRSPAGHSPPGPARGPARPPPAAPRRAKVGGMADLLRKIYHVTCRPHRAQEHLSCWDVKAEDEPEALSSHWSEDEAAVEAARLAMALLAEE